MRLHSGLRAWSRDDPISSGGLVNVNKGTNMSNEDKDTTIDMKAAIDDAAVQPLDYYRPLHQEGTVAADVHKHNKVFSNVAKGFTEMEEAVEDKATAAATATKHAAVQAETNMADGASKAWSSLKKGASGVEEALEHAIEHAIGKENKEDPPKE
ncbi:hypothetical protein FOA52_003236 [Chlamydomonas sp. UWO 241]|nr:hypothetical protein FOA52_003236 [Chlamydomonas sp. UWO 241]